MLSDWTIVRAGDTPEKSKQRLEERLDSTIVSKPSVYVKKMGKKN